MDEGQKNMREEMRAREEAERKRKQERRDREQLARSPHKKKIRVRVEQGCHSHIQRGGVFSFTAVT